MQNKRTKRFGVVLVLATLGLAPAWVAQAGPVGWGMILGDTVGVSYQNYLDRNLALDAAVGASAGYYVNPGLSLHGDLMWTDLMAPDQSVRWFYHLGGGLGFAFGRELRSNEVDLRFTAGTEYFFPHSRFAVFGELVPCIVFAAPGFSLHFAGWRQILSLKLGRMLPMLGQ